MDEIYIIAMVVGGCVLGLIPAIIAKNKGYNFGLWWLYGAAIFIVAIIHALILQDKNTQSAIRAQKVVSEDLNVADEIRKCKQLLDDGAITEEEFEQIKKRLLKM